MPATAHDALGPDEFAAALPSVFTRGAALTYDAAVRCARDEHDGALAKLGTPGSNHSGAARRAGGGGA